LSEEFSVFLIDLGLLDVLLCAGDFYGAASESDSSSGTGPGNGSGSSPATLDAGSFYAKGRAHEKFLLEPILQSFSTRDTPAEGAAPTAFLMNSADGRAFACIVERGFEMVSLPLQELRLLPAGLKGGRPGRGIMAVRFASENRIQYLLDLKAMAEGGSTI